MELHLVQWAGFQAQHLHLPSEANSNPSVSTFSHSIQVSVHCVDTCTFAAGNANKKAVELLYAGPNIERVEVVINCSSPAWILILTGF